MVMLAKVVVEVCDDYGNIVQCRVVLDSGSQVNFVTNQCARRLGLFLVDAAVSLNGVQIQVYCPISYQYQNKTQIIYSSCMRMTLLAL